ncbi:MAG: [FeFe] hydrogenase H-cluster radical SAM maturase HydG [Myxococcales bacterium]|jgi:2-iminoacetate synthase|nr:[FeFe] hydrogenase H-cluster radical SAM maturase HydG [Myxococcales bacterium]
MSDASVAQTGDFIQDGVIAQVLDRGAAASPTEIREILAKALELKGLSLSDVAALSKLRDPELCHALFEAARAVKERIYGTRMVLFAPLYISNLCNNECLYCAFRASNRELERRALSRDDITREVEELVDQGHKRVLMVAGERYPQEGFRYVLDAIDAIYAVKRPKGEIRRVNVNVAPLSVDEFRELKAARIGTFQLFQETYHRGVYAEVHRGGPKRNYDFRVTAMDRAMAAGIDDVGIGPLLGLADWRFEILALLQHIHHLEERFGVGPHTISIPRIEPACGSDMATRPPNEVSDDDFRKIVAILRLAVPYTGLILSTRESAAMRHELIGLGISQVSAGSRTNPGGYTEREDEQAAQFHLGDHRSLEEVVVDLMSMGHIPSFCTGCYRMGRTGKDFMDLARPGDIRRHCDPNGLSTFLEYLIDFASPETRQMGERLIQDKIERMAPIPRAVSQKLVERVRSGQRDAYV